MPTIVALRQTVSQGVIEDTPLKGRLGLSPVRVAGPLLRGDGAGGGGYFRGLGATA
ncbi:MAG: hypothetical protein QF797_20755 [Alphaproteobacteria bacterium]|nr:hypothetical protein [Alphaproteobacteria bacterium]MDP6622487.1 hypothetical protein [Alphaproteobacteria bacterium]